MPNDATTAYVHLDRRLASIADKLHNGEVVQPITVRTLLAWNGASRRGYWVVYFINQALAKAGLQTNPDFESAYIDAYIRFEIKKPGEIGDGTWATESPIDVSSIQGPDVATARPATDPTIRISRLAAANKALISVKPDVPLAEAVTLMLYYDYSQLPVMPNDRDVKGVISWNSIGARLATGAVGSRVRELMDAHIEIQDDVSLFDAIPVVVKNQYVLVRAASDRRISGIVTSSDLGLQFKQLAEPFLLLGEIENYIRHVIAVAAFSTDVLSQVKDPNDPDRVIGSAADLTFGEYIRLLQSEVHWATAGLPIDRAEFCKLLEEVRQIRNDVMHFDPDGVDDDALDKLRRLTAMFQRLGTIDGLRKREAC